jgi:GxxExxY protein
MKKLLHSEVTDDILSAFFRVYNTLGFGFLEKVYENSMAISLREMRHSVRQQHPIQVKFDGALVGEYFDDRVIVELKAAEALAKDHQAQLLNYLKATDFEV